MGTDSASSINLRTALEALGTATTKHRGERLFEQGKNPAGIYLIRSGHVALLVEHGRKKACTQVAGAGALIGLPAVMANSSFSVTAEVLDDTEVVFIPRELVVNTLRHSQELCMQALDVLGQQVQEVRRVLGGGKPAVN